MSENHISLPDPVQQAAVKFLVSLSGSWTPIHQETLSESEIQALDCLIRCGWLRMRLEVTVIVRESPLAIRLRCRVTGTYESCLLEKIGFLLPDEWIDRSLRVEWTNARLTVYGEEAKGLWEKGISRDLCHQIIQGSRIDLFVLQAARPYTVDIHGQVDVEERWIENTSDALAVRLTPSPVCAQAQAIASAKATVGDIVINNQIHLPPSEANSPPAGDTVKMTATQAADYVGINERTMRNWIRDHKIQAESTGGTDYVFSRHELDAFRAAQAGKTNRTQAN